MKGPMTYSGGAGKGYAPKHDGHGMSRASSGELKHEGGSAVHRGFGKEIPAHKFDGKSLGGDGKAAAEHKASHQDVFDGDEDGY